ncbi:MAG: hypothetical protein HRT40_00800 [Campylobacteraceae bacterium]|nr:hypothetical protein [Campylobacteraceae bacterium]
MNYTKTIQKHIEKLVGELKGEDHLIEILKRKLTKKEYKVLVSKESGHSDAEIALEIRVEESRVEEINKALIKKLNQEKIKNELCR